MVLPNINSINVMIDPVFSIIIPTYNSANTIKKAVVSILEQTFSSYEIIIVDGLSKDDTLGVIRQTIKNDNRVIVVSERDKGIYDAMNKGIRMSKGEWVYFLGSDDWLYDSEVLEKVNECKANENVDYIYGKVYSPKLKGLYGHKDYYDRIFFENICHQAIFYKKSIHNLVGLYNLDYKLYADWEFNIKCFEDSAIRKEYLDIIVAHFADGGASSVNADRDFLKKFLFPKNIGRLSIYGSKTKPGIVKYDKWWRLIRSMRLEKDESMTLYSREQEIPKWVLAIEKAQKGCNKKYLWNGFYSKMLMIINYLLR